MVATLGRIVADYRGLVEVCQQRAIELEISRLEIDRISGLTEGFAAKLLGSGEGARPKRMWPVSLEAILGTLGLKILLIEDPAATARTLALREPVNTSRQQFGNKNRLKAAAAQIAAPEPECTYAAPVPSASPAASHSHLRVVQTKSGRKFG